MINSEHTIDVMLRLRQRATRQSIGDRPMEFLIIMLQLDNNPCE